MDRRGPCHAEPLRNAMDYGGGDLTGRDRGKDRHLIRDPRGTAMPGAPQASTLWQESRWAHPDVVASWERESLMGLAHRAR
ncbi:hypothetical protein NDU88_006382 [Pleurodeles waltl]|uniref:Uncharacterized protein n=1 Tax=Pleurodeles waltl TaxID=8319 RepID=A0AAV7PL89_PLEWA|nr:hypothetical protein NDU88_006382 [Pleurodeles waltl]